MLRLLIKKQFPDSYQDIFVPWVLPIDHGVSYFEPEDTIQLGLTVPAKQSNSLLACLEQFHSDWESDPSVHFKPSENLELIQIQCRISGKRLPENSPVELAQEHILPEVHQLLELPRFTLVFHNPLRLKRPSGSKQKGHRFVDEELFQLRDEKNNILPYILQSIEYSNAEVETHPLTIQDHAFNWMDLSYGGKHPKTIGGTIGYLSLQGKLDVNTAERLVIGQYLGIGKNRAFGFGFYEIPEIQKASQIQPITRGVSLLQKIVTVKGMKQSLAKLKHSAPGSDHLTKDDLKALPDSWWSEFTQTIIKGDWSPGEPLWNKKYQSNHAVRVYAILPVLDRLLQKRLVEGLGSAIDRLLSSSSYAYRQGLNREGAIQALVNALNQGYLYGCKGDIASFFPSIHRERLFTLMQAYFPKEPAIPMIRHWMDTLQKDQPGLPLGAALSPLLSNLYMIEFDKSIVKSGVKLIRYADDFVVLHPETQYEPDIILASIRMTVKRLGLAINESKLQWIDPDSPFVFLGYLVSRDGYSVYSEENQPDPLWQPTFIDQWNRGSAVYISTNHRGCHSKGTSLYIRHKNQTEQGIAWKKINRLVLIGNASVSSGVLQSAMKQQVPIFWLDIFGKLKGSLVTEEYRQQELTAFQLACFGDESMSLALAKEVIGCKIHNMKILLRRNKQDVSSLDTRLSQLDKAQSIPELLGMEGAASRFYFSGFKELVAPFVFEGRRYHPPPCPVNAMLSLGYTLLYNRINASLSATGFNTRLGFLHQPHGSHAVLASDLIEEVRHLVDRVVLRLIRKKMIKPEHFSALERGDVTLYRLNHEGFRKFIEAFEWAMAQHTQYDENQNISYNAYLDEMSRKLARTVRLMVSYQGLRIY